MNRRILNVDNGPGSNGLRGGIKQYSQKVTTGPWLDTYGGPMGYRRGFTCPDFQTEAQHAQLGVTLKPPGEFGAEIPAVETMDAKGNALNASYGTENWVSNTKATHPNFGVIKKVGECNNSSLYFCGGRLPAFLFLYRRTLPTSCCSLDSAGRSCWSIADSGLATRKRTVKLDSRQSLVLLGTQSVESLSPIHFARCQELPSLWRNIVAD